MITITILNKKYINDTGNLLVVEFTAQKGDKSVNLKYGFVPSELKSDSFTPFMEISDEEIKSILMSYDWSILD